MGRRSQAARIATVTLNPAVDLSFELDRLTPTQKLRCDHLRRDPGGGGINVARVIRRLGGEALAIFPAGGPTGDRLGALLDRERTPRLTIPVGAETRESFAAEERATGDQYRFVMPGERLQAAEWRAVLAAVAAQTPQILVASGSLPPGVPVGVYGRLARSCKSAGCKLVLDAASAPLAEGLAAGVWLAKPNVAELEEISGASLPDTARRLAACRSLVASGAAELVALSMGAEGALLVCAEGAWRAQPPALNPVSTVGCGDSFVGGLVYALAAGSDHPVALGWAVAAGTAASLAEGTQLCFLADVRRLRRETIVCRL
jgi:6-phosphofructokinase 2